MPLSQVWIILSFFISTLSHYDRGSSTEASVSNDFDCGDWLLYVVSAVTFNVRAETTRKTQMTSPAAGMGRAVTSGVVSVHTDW